MRGGCCEKNLRGYSAERVNKTKCGGCKKNWGGGGYAGEGKEDKMRGCGKNF